MLIKLTAVPNPDIEDGREHAVYIDASRVLFITRGSVQFTKVASGQARRAAYDQLWKGVQILSEQVGAYIPDMSDPVAVGWFTRARETVQQVSNAYSLWSKAYGHLDSYPRQPCTEVQLACGTALEHGVMLTRVWVKESPEEVYEAITTANGRIPIGPL